MTSSALASEERYQFEHYKDDIGAPVVQASIASIVIVLLFVPVRLYAQSTLTRWWALVDTWLIFAAAALSLTTSGLSIAMVRYGLGRHTLRVIMDDENAPYNAVMVARLGYILFVLSAPELACIKLAILTFYSRIFKIRESRNAFFWSVWAIGIFSLALGIATTVEYITACLPPAWYWTRIYVALQIYDFDGPKSGTCEAPLPHSVIPLSLDLASEIAIIILPMPYLWKLNLPRGKKASLIVAFGIGAFVTAISVVRIVAAAKIRSINDFTFDDTAATMWNPIQQSLAVACACIPACAPLYRSVSNKMSTFSASISSRVPRMGSLSTGTTATRVSSTRMPKDSGRHPWDRIGVIEDVDDDEIAVFHKRSDGSFRTSPRNVEAGYNLRTYPPSTAVRHDSLSVSDIG